MSISVSKNNNIVFRPYDRFVVASDVHMNGVRVEFLDQMKFLGIVLANRLNFDAHIDV